MFHNEGDPAHEIVHDLGFHLSQVSDDEDDAYMPVHGLRANQTSIRSPSPWSSPEQKKKTTLTNSQTSTSSQTSSIPDCLPLPVDWGAANNYSMNERELINFEDTTTKQSL